METIRVTQILRYSTHAGRVEGLIINDWRVFFMGHKGSMEATYTVNKGLPRDVIEKMRSSYAKAAEKYLTTTKTQTMSQEQINQTITRQFLIMAGYSEKEVDSLDIAIMTPTQIQDLIRKKGTEALGLNGNGKQKIVSINDVKNWITQGSSSHHITRNAATKLNMFMEKNCLEENLT